MASSGQRVYHQDYIARIRYSNALPPPPNPPKLLEIPNTGLASGQYTSAGFASRLAREQPLNIEADAELGMPIDLVGLPGVFEGDEAVLLSGSRATQLHPHDRALLRPLSTLGKPSSVTAGVSFLRRTEYITASGLRMDSSGAGSAALRGPERARQAARKKRLQTDAEKNEPVNILRNIVKGFDVAHPEDAYKGPDTTSNLRAEDVSREERNAWLNPKHPSRPDLKLLDQYPLLPDLDALPDNGSYIVTKFQTNPAAAPADSERYDERLDVGVLRIQPADAEALERYTTALAAFQEDPSQPEPAQPYNYEFFLPAVPSSSAARGIKRKFGDPSAANDDTAYTHEGVAADGTPKRCWRYERVRAYETYQQTGDARDAYGDTLALALHDAEPTAAAAGQGGRLAQKAAYYYPVVTRTFIRPRRAKPGMYVEDSDRIDVLEVEAREADEAERALRDGNKAVLEGREVDVDVEGEGGVEAEAEAEGEGHAEEEEEEAEAEADAEGEADVDAEGEEA
ncbi:uncharacterized protein K452DRAFT_280807 [Aplosporella prunicola CBS 121167]|uniref:Paf1 complex protein n=1 Tax=Aplosporella prunicola CBS 121167 TaxID=1176127 RepID=A0A6A6AVF3_9PEZI|nr:uncharacterized protein K452DRAFT_280807 [Aplosporella prunicola CBS 121167]KAF2135919.1 hypothetical protein K452DRAFT_280807 [Aplosporella prunicola CBS 121167]